MNIKQELWETELYDEFASWSIKDCDRIKQFMDKTLSTTVSKKAMREEIEGRKKPSLTEPVRKGIIGTMAINFEYNQALSDLLSSPLLKDN